MALTTLASVKAQGGILPGDTGRDAQLRVLIEGVSSFVKRFLNRDLESRQYHEYYSGDGSPILVLNQYPVTSVSQVGIDESGYFGSAPIDYPSVFNLIEGVDFALMSGAAGQGSAGMLRRIGDVWTRPRMRSSGRLTHGPGAPSGNIQVQYTAGFTVIPPAITMAVNALVLKQASAAALGGNASQLRYEDASVSFFPSDDAVRLIGSIESILAGYRSVPI